MQGWRKTDPFVMCWQVVYSTTGQVGEQPMEKPQENGNEDDFDIDAI